MLSPLADYAAFVADLASGKVNRVKPPIEFDYKPSPDSRAGMAYAQMQKDVKDPARFDNIRTKYETAYGFSPHFHSGRPRQTIWYPFRSLKPWHLSASLAVASVLNRRPQDVLAVWVAEGQAATDVNFTRRLAIPFRPPADVSRAEVMQAVRGWVLFSSFGADAFTAVGWDPNAQDTGWLAPGSTDRGPDPEMRNKTHDQKYKACIDALKRKAIPGPIADDPAGLATYTTTYGGAFTRIRVRDGSCTAEGSEFVDIVPAGTDAWFCGSLALDSIATWLYLEAALFQGGPRYEPRMVHLIEQEYQETDTDLSEQPWITYLAWNGTADEQYPAFLGKQETGAQSFEDAKKVFFGEDIIVDQPGELPQKQLQKEYPVLYKGWSTETAPPHGYIPWLPFATAITVKYLSEAMATWFE